MHDPAPQPEARRGHAESVAVAELARAHRRRGHAARLRRALRQSRHVRVFARRVGRRRRRLRLHRGQPAAAGRAPRHRGSVRRRSRAGPDSRRRRAVARGDRRRRRARAARLCDRGAGQSRGDDAFGRDRPERGANRGLRYSFRPGSARRYVIRSAIPAMALSRHSILSSRR